MALENGQAVRGRYYVEALGRGLAVLDCFIDQPGPHSLIELSRRVGLGIDRVGAYLQERFRDFGFSTSFDKQAEYGDHLVAIHTGQKPEGPRLLLI